MGLVNLKATAKGMLSSMRQYANDCIESIEQSALDACEYLALIAIDEAEARYESYEGEEGNTVIVTGPYGVRDGKSQVGYYIESSGVAVYDVLGNRVGNSVVMEEFGSGIVAGSHPTNDFPEYNYAGSYSEKHGTGEFASTGQWHHNGKQYVYIPATYAMYLAGQKVETEAKKTLQETSK